MGRQGCEWVDVLQGAVHMHEVGCTWNHDAVHEGTGRAVIAAVENVLEEVNHRAISHLVE
eukprot:CAMPEP_0181212612 /NCGR_PEP_ID=MMETSP1096-20121128/24443_1 /TAXON_ID=156174 ORGANISM="Chrysochromulina ericina, Strain CCMP281" /NCGR_SAMPLE_ID=MMETSP1096 /ASSEMBLY_ACC=CAM_ASM_000453 /LENGTH=59 /DNA_ID=CAMNT_0023304153 /DNA_START=356 /DNA_END=535 /DNA_ORIENTATION=-